MNMNEMVTKVKAHALAHYEDGGWDVIVECWDDKQIVSFIMEEIEFRGPVTEDEVMEALEGIVSIYADREADAINSAF